MNMLIDTAPEKIYKPTMSGEEGIRLGYNIVSIENDINTLYNQIDKLFISATSLESITNSVDNIDLSDITTSLLVSSIETISHSLDLPVGYLSIEDNNTDRIKAFVKNVWKSIMIAITKMLGYVKKWYSKILLSLSASDEEREKLVELLKKRGENSTIIVPADRKQNEVDGGVRSAILTFDKRLEKVMDVRLRGEYFKDEDIDNILALTDTTLNESDIDYIREVTASPKGEISVILLNRGVFKFRTIMYSDVFKLPGTGTIKDFTLTISKDHIKPGETTIKDIGIDIELLTSTLELDKKKVLGKLEKAYEAAITRSKKDSKKLKTITSNETMLRAKDEILGNLKDRFKTMTGFVDIYRDAITVARLIEES